MKPLSFFLLAFLIINLIACDYQDQPPSTNNNIGTKVSHNLSESDRHKPTILASEGWKIIGYGGWNWKLTESATISRLNSAEVFFKKAIELDPANADAYAGLARVIQIKGYIPQSIVKFKKDSCQKALDLIERAPVRDTNNFNIHYIKSETLLCLEDFDGAIREAEKIQEISDTCLSHILKSISYYEKYRQQNNASDKDMAILEGTDYLECMQNSNQGDSLAHINLWSILNESKDYNSTVEYFKSNLAAKPYSQWSYRNYVWVLLQRNTLDDLNEVEKTITEAKKVINCEIDSMQLYSNRGDTYFKLKQYNRAYNDYNKLLSINTLSISKERLVELCSKFNDGRCIKTWHNRIQTYLEFGDCHNALEEFNVNYSAHPQSFESLKDSVAQCKLKK